MDCDVALWTASWRIWPAAILVAGGVLLAIRGAWRQRRGLARPVTDARKGVAFAHVLRAVLVGLSIATMGIAWMWQLPTVCLVAAVIGAEELLETSVVIAALDDAERRGIWEHAPRACTRSMIG